MPKVRFLVLLLPLSLLVASLGGSAALMACSGTGAINDCFDYKEFDGTTPAVHFQADVLPIFRNSCGLSMSCHGAISNSMPAQHFYGPSKALPDPSPSDIQAIFDQSVGQPSVGEPSMENIKPGDPAHSFMMYKLDGDPMILGGVNCATLKCVTNPDGGCGLTMPSGGPQLPEEQRDIIRRWIAQGAKND
jgi:hypothetical protein